MAKTKYEKALIVLENMIKELNSHTEKVDRLCDAVLVYFYEPFLIHNKIPIGKRTFENIAKSHYCAMRYVASTPELKEYYKSKSFYAFKINKYLYRPEEEYVDKRNSQLGGVPLNSMNQLPNDTSKIRQNSIDKALLLCPHASEISKEIVYFENEEEADSIVFHFHNFAELSRRNKIIEKNLEKQALPIYLSSLEQWKKPDRKHNDPIPKRAKVKSPFEPTVSHTIKNAYKLMFKSRYLKESKHLQGLWTIYNQFLQKEMFEGLLNDDPLRKAYIEEWNLTIKGKKFEQCKTLKARWPQNSAVDINTAANLLRYFIDGFKNSQRNEYLDAVCIMWLLIQSSNQITHNAPSVNKILKLSSRNINRKNSQIKLDKNIFNISIGLYQLLLCLKGKATNDRRLFINITDMKYLERLFSEASLELGLNPKVLPASFLSFPHTLHGFRIAQKERKMKRERRPLVPYRSQPTRDAIKRALMEQKEKSSKQN